jgi:hypothetical protein
MNSITFIKRYLNPGINWGENVNVIIGDALIAAGGDQNAAAIQVLEWAQGHLNNLSSETLGDYSYTINVQNAMDSIERSLMNLRLDAATASLSCQSPQATLLPNSFGCGGWR